jgi:hypothetical protein
MLYVLVAGVMWGTWLSLARIMTRYDAATFLTDGKHVIANLAVVMAVLMVAALVVGLVAVAHCPRTGRKSASGGRRSTPCARSSPLARSPQRSAPR